MKTIKLWGFFIFLAGLFPFVVNAIQPEIKLTGRKDFVINTESRQTVLKIGYMHLTEKENDFLVQVDELKNPYTFKEPETPEIVDPEPNDPVDVEEERPVVPIRYDDASVLARVAESFSKQVRGSIARGETSYLQLEGGTLLKPGTSFPVSLAQAGDQTFTLTISEINSDGYTLELGSASKQISYDNVSRTSSGSVKFSNQ